jgi:uncharacterized membrane protein YbhN (UPF0104 family)
MKRWQKPLIIILTLVFVVLIITNISLKSVINSLLSIGWMTLLICLGLHLMVYLFRCLALNIFLKKEVPFRYLMAAHFIHNFYLNILPANMGELSLPLLLNRFVSKARSLSALLITRICSAGVLLALFAASLYIIFHNIEKFDFSLKHIVLGVIFLGAIAMIGFLLSKIKVKSNRILDYVKEKLLKLKNSLLFSLKNELTFFNVIFLLLVTLGYLTFMALYYQLVLSKLQIKVNLIEMFYLMSLQMAMLIVPIRSFAGIGTTEGVWMLGMMSLGIGSSLALQSGVVIHIIQLMTGTVFFLIGLPFKHVLDRKAD